MNDWNLEPQVLSGDTRAVLLQPHQVLVSIEDSDHYTWLQHHLIDSYVIVRKTIAQEQPIRHVLLQVMNTEKLLPSGYIQVHPWVLDALELCEGDRVHLELCNRDVHQLESGLTLTVDGRYPIRTVSTRMKHTRSIVENIAQLPESVRTGLLDLHQVLQRQIRIMYDQTTMLQTNGLLLPIQILGEIFIFRVCPPLVNESIHVIGYTTHDSVVATTFDEDKRTFDQRLWDMGMVGYTPFVTNVLFHICLNFRGNTTDHLTCPGILIHGAAGVGKSLLLRTLEAELSLQYPSLNVICMDGITLSMEYENSKVSSAFDFLSTRFESLAGNTTGTVILIDDIDVLFTSSSGQSLNTSEDDSDTALLVLPLASALLRYMDTRTSAYCILGTTTTLKVSSIPSVARRTGRLEKTLEMIVPTESMRREVVRKHLESIIQTNSSKLSTQLAAITGGYVAKDLVRIIRLAFLLSEQQRQEHENSQMKFTWHHLVTAQRQIQPSQLRELNVASPGTSESDHSGFAGYSSLCKELDDFINWKFHPTQAMQRLGVTHATGLLLYGPSGCGKSLLVHQLASHARVNFVSIKSSEIVSKYFGESEKQIRVLFARARAAAPCILFFDEFDAIAHKRSFGEGDSTNDGNGVYARILSTFLNELDGVGISSSSKMIDGEEKRENEILVIAATNRKDALDAALIRPGRMDKTIEVGYPCLEDRIAILEYYTRKMPITDDVKLHVLASRSSGNKNVTGADLAAVCKDAAFRALRENIEATTIRSRHFEDAWDQRVSKYH